MRRALLGALLLGSLALLSHVDGRADGPADNQDEKVRRVPPPGVPIPEEARKELAAGVEQLGKEIESLKTALKANAKLLALLPDVQIYYNAIHYALKYDEFLNAKGLEGDLKAARGMIKSGMDRAAALKDGKAPWATATGNVVRGYVSRIDGSVQPYGLVVPATYQANSPYRHRLDLWCHGRGEMLTELSFLQQRSNSAGEFTPANAFVLHPYGRYCNANKFAGEVDILEAMEHVQKNYPIDADRVVMRGFSMGGAACWQMAVHYPSLFCAAAPGAGFSETPEFLKVFQSEDVSRIPEWERKLWRLYDCPGYAVNLFNLPTVAYSGENDTQKQAADAMERALRPLGIQLTHVIGPKTGHSYEANAKREINRRIDLLAAKGRPAVPEVVKFTTYTLRYPQSYWVRIDRMTRHWEPAEIQARIEAPNKLHVTARGVEQFTLQFPPGGNPLSGKMVIHLNGDASGMVVEALPQSDGSLAMSYARVARKGADGKPGSEWSSVPANVGVFSRGPIKAHGLQGPIDDAFMDRFIIVRPTGKGRGEATQAWVEKELQHAITHWRLQFRGEAIVKDDTQVTEADARASNLILFGDDQSNAYLKQIAARLPVKWAGDELECNGTRYPAASHMPALIYPNPQAGSRYVVLNSGFTFREYDYLNNARQVPKLPDYAVIDISKPITPRRPGGIVQAGFFDEDWAFEK